MKKKKQNVGKIKTIARKKILPTDQLMPKFVFTSFASKASFIRIFDVLRRWVI